MYVLTISTIFTGLAALTVALRVYTRFRLIKSPGVDDLLILVALVCISNFGGRVSDGGIWT